MHAALLAAQPDLDADGLSPDDLVTLVQDAGVTDQRVADCVTGGDFTDWAAEVTDRAAVSTSPVLLVGGQEYTGAVDDADALTAFVEEVSTQLAADAADAADAG